MEESLCSTTDGQEISVDSDEFAKISAAAMLILNSTVPPAVNTPTTEKKTVATETAITRNCCFRNPCDCHGKPFPSVEEVAFSEEPLSQVLTPKKVIMKIYPNNGQGKVAFQVSKKDNPEAKQVATMKMKNLWYIDLYEQIINSSPTKKAVQNPDKNNPTSQVSQEISLIPVPCLMSRNWN